MAFYNSLLFVLFFDLEAPSPDEVEAYLVLQECLEMRKRYVFKEAVAPWEKEVISDPSTPKPNPEPFLYTREGKSDVSFSYCFRLFSFCEDMVILNLFYFFVPPKFIHLLNK